MSCAASTAGYLYAVGIIGKKKEREARQEQQIEPEKKVVALPVITYKRKREWRKE